MFMLESYINHDASQMSKEGVQKKKKFTNDLFLVKTIQLLHEQNLKQQIAEKIKYQKTQNSKDISILTIKKDQEIKNLNDQIKDKQDQIDKLNGQLQQFETEKQTIIHESQMLRLEVKQLKLDQEEKERNDMLSTNKKVEKIIEQQLNKEVARLEDQNSKLEENVKQLTSGRFELEAHLKNQQRQFMLKREQMNEQHINNEKAVQDLIAKLGQSQGKDAKTTVEQLRELENKYIHLQQANTWLEKKNETLEKQMQEIIDHMHEMRVDLAAEIQASTQISLIREVQKFQVDLMHTLLKQHDITLPGEIEELI